MKEKQIEIIAILKGSPKPLTINEVANFANIDRHTAGRYLESLESMGVCSFSPKGKSKLWSITSSALLHVLSDDNPLSSELGQILSLLDDEITINSKEHEVIWANKATLATQKCHERLADCDTPCAKCAVEDAFMTRRMKESTCHGKRIVAKPIVGTNNQVLAVFAIRKSDTLK